MEGVDLAGPSARQRRQRECVCLRGQDGPVSERGMETETETWMGMGRDEQRQG